MENCIDFDTSDSRNPLTDWWHLAPLQHYLSNIVFLPTLNIVCTIYDNSHATLLVYLDLSTTFDTSDLAIPDS